MPKEVLRSIEAPLAPSAPIAAHVAPNKRAERGVVDLGVRLAGREAGKRGSANSAVKDGGRNRWRANGGGTGVFKSDTDVVLPGVAFLCDSGVSRSATGRCA